MTDFRFPDRWLHDRRVMSLAGDDFKAFVVLGTWMVTNRTDGMLDAEDLEYLPRAFNQASIPRLIINGLLIEEGNGWMLVDYQGTQTSKAEFEVLENARRADREKKARQRAAKKSTGDSPGDMSRGTTQAGQDRQDRQDRQGREGVPQSVMQWPTAVPGSPRNVA